MGSPESPSKGTPQKPQKEAPAVAPAVENVEKFSLYNTIVHNTLLPLFLMITTPLLLIIFWIIIEKYGGSLQLVLEKVQANPERELLKIWNEWPMPTWTAAKIIATFAALQAFLQIFTPGPVFYGPITPRGNRPAYRLNGPLAHLLTYIIMLVIYIYDKTYIYMVFDNFGNILQTLSVFSLCVCVLLYFKGIFLPSSTDSGASGNPVMDIFWGTELHPTIFGFSLKQFANCRFGMMSWCALLLVYLMKQHQLYGYVSNSMWISFGLQALYCFKFFLWEGGYFHTLDIMHDRFGYYIYWGVTCWLPGIYTLTGFYLTRHPIQWQPLVAVALFVTGAYFIYINWDADEQRTAFRADPDNFKINGRPANYLKVKYTVEKIVNGKTVSEEKDSVLLHDGWWGIARHFHYVPELLGTLFWCLPAGFDNIFIPYFYFFYLTYLLVHRLTRDEERCQKKYGKFWTEYCTKVPYRFIPYIF
jgi:7-dehydrocholesterol reductase